MRKGKQLTCLLFAWFLLLVASPFALEAQPDTWVTTFGSDVDDYPEDILVDQAGNVYVAGFFRDTMLIGGQSLISAGESDIFVAKFDANGQLDWAQRYGHVKNDVVHAMAFDTMGNIMVVGEYQDSSIIGLDTLDSQDTTWNGNRANTTDALWFRLSPAGALQQVWTGGWFGSEKFYDVLIDPRNNQSYISGIYRTYNNWALNGQWWTNGHGRGYDDAIWIRSTGGQIDYRGVAKGTFVDKGKTLDLIDDSLVVMGGTFQDTCWFVDSVYYQLGNFEDDVFVSCYGDTGVFKWVTIGSSKGIDDLAALVTDAQGNIFFTGTFDSVFTMGGLSVTGSAFTDGYVGKMDHNGQMIWLKAVAGKGFEQIEDIQLTNSGDLILTGYFQREIDLGNGVMLELADTMDQNAFVLKMDGAGNFLWARSLGGSSPDRGINVQAASNGYIYAMGTFTGEGVFGQFSATSAGGTEAYLLKMNADGAVGVEEVTPSNLSAILFPNPAKDRVEIQFEVKRSSEVRISLLDIQGSTRMAQTIPASGSGIKTAAIDLSNVAAGMYIVQLASKEGQSSIKLVVTK